MIGKSQIKRVASLHQKKYRKEFAQFIAEGPKVISELLQSRFALRELYATGDSGGRFSSEKAVVVAESDLRKMSALTTPAGCLAVFEIPEAGEPSDTGLTVVLDDIRDPGNLGTIIRLCDWFGVREIVCSEETVDAFNPKVVQATMGSLARVGVFYTDVARYLKSQSRPVFGTFMEGRNIYECAFPSDAVVVFGNESNGISDEVGRIIAEKISIPRFGSLQQTESLNVATASAIVLSEFRRSHSLA